MSKPRVLGGRYKLEERIASGGMGTVYIAADKRLGRRVALKLLGEHLAHDATYIERFRREARAAAALSHTNIAGVFDYGEDSGAHYLIMELVAGNDLATLLREEGKIAPERSVAIAAQTAEALGHAHMAGMIHRDVKPGNILVTRDDRVKVTDFGIARTAGDVTLTATGSVLGTAHYVSPEQASGSVMGPPSDVYSLGIVMFEMLTGAVPFTGDSMVSVAMRHVNEDVPPPSSITPEVPAEIDAVVRRATARDPDERYADGSEMGAALLALGATKSSPATAVLVPPASAPTAVMEPTGASRPVPFEQRWEPQRIGRIVVIAFLTLILALFLLGAFRFIQGPPALDQATPEETETTEVQEETTEVQEELFVLPDVRGRDADEVRKELEEEGFEVEVEVVDDERPEETILATDPEPGSTLEPDQTVTLTVSSGEVEDEDDDDDNPGQGKGNGKGKDKDKSGKKDD